MNPLEILGPPAAGPPYIHSHALPGGDWVDCPDCDGGWLDDEATVMCRTCRGTGGAYQQPVRPPSFTINQEEGESSDRV